MKIFIEEYNPNWINQFETLESELGNILSEFDPVIEHFGSTSVPGLAAKPIIDILVGIPQGADIELLIKRMVEGGYIYFEAFNEIMEDRRLFIRLKEDAQRNLFEDRYRTFDEIPHEEIHSLRWAHVHVREFGNNEWYRHIAFREYLKSNKTVREQYEDLKRDLCKKEWKNNMEYSVAKDPFIHTEEKKAVLWWKDSHRNGAAVEQ